MLIEKTATKNYVMTQDPSDFSKALLSHTYKQT